ncbi:MAG: hypothetical protein AB1762_12925 [Gemmatimonadota bacterium]
MPGSAAPALGAFGGYGSAPATPLLGFAPKTITVEEPAVKVPKGNNWLWALLVLLAVLWLASLTRRSRRRR